MKREGDQGEVAKGSGIHAKESSQREGSESKEPTHSIAPATKVAGTRESLSVSGGACGGVSTAEAGEDEEPGKDVCEPADPAIATVDVEAEDMEAIATPPSSPSSCSVQDSLASPDSHPGKRLKLSHKPSKDKGWLFAKSERLVREEEEEELKTKAHGSTESKHCEKIEARERRIAKETDAVSTTDQNAEFSLNIFDSTTEDTSNRNVQPKFKVGASCARDTSKVASHAELTTTRSEKKTLELVSTEESQPAGLGAETGQQRQDSSDDNTEGTIRGPRVDRTTHQASDNSAAAALPDPNIRFFFFICVSSIIISRGSELILVCPCICLRMSCPGQCEHCLSCPPPGSKKIFNSDIVQTLTLSKLRLSELG